MQMQKIWLLAIGLFLQLTSLPLAATTTLYCPDCDEAKAALLASKSQAALQSCVQGFGVDRCNSADENIRVVTDEQIVGFLKTYATTTTLTKTQASADISLRPLLAEEQQELKSFVQTRVGQLSKLPESVQINQIQQEMLLWDTAGLVWCLEKCQPADARRLVLNRAAQLPFCQQNVEQLCLNLPFDIRIYAKRADKLWRFRVSRSNDGELIAEKQALHAFDKLVLQQQRELWQRMTK